LPWTTEAHAPQPGDRGSGTSVAGAGLICSHPTLTLPPLQPRTHRPQPQVSSQVGFRSRAASLTPEIEPHRVADLTPPLVATTAPRPGVGLQGCLDPKTTNKKRLGVQISGPLFLSASSLYLFPAHPLTLLLIGGDCGDKPLQPLVNLLRGTFMR
jgi:hypothetical protein